jgi:ABC-2 type transport system ATP-binding protein
MTDRVVETHGLRKQFGAKLAVVDLSLSLGRAEVFGFLGPNGAGKTTSLKMLLGLVEPSGGRGTVLGAPIGNCAARARIGFLPEHFSFHDCFTGRELLRFHGRFFGLRGLPLEARIDELLARVNLDDAAERQIREYSKGMMQRLGLAQALINDPELVFLDEPTSGLDPLGRLLVRDVIRDLRDGGATVFLNSHLLGEVEATCDRVAFVKEGRTVQELSLRNCGDSLEVELKLGGTVTQRLLDGLKSFGRGATHVNGVVRLHVDAEEKVPELAHWLIENGAVVYGLQSRRRTLEERFVEIMGTDQGPG